MKWSEVTVDHDLLVATVSATSTPDSPDTGEGPFTGVIRCSAKGAVPVLADGREVHMFADWFDVEIHARGLRGTA